MFDLNLLPLKMTGGMEQAEVPGLLIASPPRRRERSRSGDVLIVLFTLPGDLLTATTRQELQQHLVTAYFRSRGTVTSALRAAIGELNNNLLRRNLRTREGAMQGLLNVAVLRRDMLTLAHVGMTQSFLLRAGAVQRLNEADNSGVGLGVSRTYGLRFSQVRIQPGDMLVLASNQPPAWKTDALEEAARLPLDQARARLLSLAGSDVEGALTLFKPGAGTVTEIKPYAAASAPAGERRSRRARRSEPRTPETAPRPEPPTETLEAPEPALYPAQVEFQSFQNKPADPPVEPEAPEADLEQPPAERTEGVYLSGAPDPTPAAPPLDPPSRPVPQRPLRQFERPPEERPARKPLALPGFDLRKRLATLWRAGRRAGRRVDRGSKAFAGRLLPGAPGQQQLSPALMLFMAVAVPIVVVAIAATIYLYAPNGRSEQQQAYLDQAMQYAAQAERDDNEVLKRNSWGQVLYWLDEADRFGQTGAAADLRKQARTALDAMDGITRMDLQPVISGGFDSNLHFDHMAASPTDVYLLDSGQGRILHMSMTGSGYQLDPRFDCGPGLISQMQFGEDPVNQVQVGPLLDLVLLPPGNAYQANVMGIDASGNLIYCKPGGLPQAAALPAPDTGWGTINNLTVDQGLLYILDKQNNRIWVYVGTDFKFENDPRLYFDNVVPELGDVASIAVNGEDMFLLHDTGQMTNCTFRQFSGDQTRCTNGVAYGDSRPGRDPNDQVSFTEAKFVSMQVTRAPDSSLYMLDASSASVYHFSLRLNLQNQYRSDTGASGTLPSSPPTAFAVTTARVILVAFDSQVYYGSMP